jgi:uncharacterized protein
VIVVDTSVLVYAVGEEHELREPCTRFVRALETGQLAATTTVEVVQKFVHVRARRHNRADATALGRDFAQLLSPLISTTEETLRDALRIFERESELGSFDALLAAAALEHRAEALLSTDTDFGRVSRLRHVSPGSDDFERLLAAT